MSDAAHRLDDAGRAALREVAPEIVMEFRGEHNRKLSTRKEMRWGSKGSFSLAIAGPKEGLWFDHETGRGGDIIEFIKLERGCSFVDALDHAAQYVSELRNGHHSSRPAHGRRHGRQLTTTATTRSASSRRSRSGAKPGRCAARWPRTYLRSRCIEVPDEALEVLRFHPRCPWGGRNAPRDGRADTRHHHRRADRHPPHGIVGRRQQDRAQGSRPERRRRDQAVALDGHRQRTPDRRRHRDRAVGDRSSVLALRHGRSSTPERWAGFRCCRVSRGSP